MNIQQCPYCGGGYDTDQTAAFEFHRTNCKVLLYIDMKILEREIKNAIIQEFQ